MAFLEKKRVFLTIGLTLLFSSIFLLTGFAAQSSTRIKCGNTWKQAWDGEVRFPAKEPGVYTVSATQNFEKVKVLINAGCDVKIVLGSDFKTNVYHCLSAGASSELLLSHFSCVYSGQENPHEQDGNILFWPKILISQTENGYMLSTTGYTQDGTFEPFLPLAFTGSEALPLQTNVGGVHIFAKK